MYLDRVAIEIANPSLLTSKVIRTSLVSWLVLMEDSCQDVFKVPQRVAKHHRRRKWSDNRGLEVYECRAGYITHLLQNMWAMLT